MEGAQAMESIEVDWDIHKLIEAERRGFEEPPYVALRRLLSLPSPLGEEAGKAEVSSQGIAWSEDGVTVPHGTAAKMEYLHGRQSYEGRFENGRLMVNGRSFSTLSEAASALAVTKDGTKTNLNGWLYWQVRLPGQSRWTFLRDMRSKR
jgi:hypothetical protein